jgi:hypothetical protein
MPALAVLVHTTCKICGAACPVRGYVDKIVCHNCQRPSELLDWDWVVKASWKGKTESVVREKSHPSLLGEACPSTIACPKCQAEFPESLILAGLAKSSAATPGTLDCPKCKASVTLRAAPQKSASGTAGKAPARTWNAFIAEDPRLVLGSEQTPPEPPPGAIAFACTSCGAQLSVDGESRTPTCQFCSCRVFLPDPLWNALHPPPKVSPFYLWLDPGKVALQASIRRFDAWSMSFLIVAILWLLGLGPVFVARQVIDNHHGVVGMIALALVVEVLLVVICGLLGNRGSVSD